MPNYYTKSGQYIRNPDAYAKTGAPMYTSKYNKVCNINKPHDIYKVECEGGKKYIGKTANIDKRMDQHFSGNGSKVTQKFKPKSAEVIDSCPGFFSDKLEQKHTEKEIKKHGYNNVRGGKYTNSKTLNTSYYTGTNKKHTYDEYYSSDSDSDSDSD
jgi:predicted GIY-YIG superfamily endonuclease